MTHMPLTQAPYRPEAPTAPKLTVSLVQRLFAVWRQRQQLERLPDHMRRDIGLTDAQIATETARPLWDAPSAWRL